MRAKRDNDGIVSATTQALSALGKHLPPSLQIPAGEKLITAPEFATVFQTALDARAAVVVARGQYKAALAARRQADAARRVHDDALKAWVLHRFGPSSSVTHDFGYAQRPRSEPSAQAKADAVRLNKATRKARGTLGPKQKLQIKGTRDDAPDASPAPAAPQTHS
jgi:hypothetical protein